MTMILKDGADRRLDAVVAGLKAKGFQVKEVERDTDPEGNPVIYIIFSEGES